MMSAWDETCKIYPPDPERGSCTSVEKVEVSRLTNIYFACRAVLVTHREPCIYWDRSDSIYINFFCRFQKCTLYSCGGYPMFDVWRWWNIECFITWTSPWWRDLLSVRLFVSRRTGTPENTDISVPIPKYFLKLAKGLVAYINIDARVGKDSSIWGVSWDVSVELLTIPVPVHKIMSPWIQPWMLWYLWYPCWQKVIDCGRRRYIQWQKSKRISHHLTLYSLSPSMS